MQMQASQKVRPSVQGQGVFYSLSHPWKRGPSISPFKAGQFIDSLLVVASPAV